MSSLISKINDLVSDLEMELDGKDTEIDDLTSKNERLENEIDELTYKNELFENEIKELQDEINGLREVKV